MTNEEALKWLTDLRSSLAAPCGSALSEERKQFAEAVDVAIEALSRDRWISVEETPEKNGRYIVAYEDAVSILDFFNGGWYFPWRTSDGIAHEETGTLQAWRPLPEPPDHIGDGNKMVEPPKEET